MQLRYYTLLLSLVFISALSQPVIAQEAPEPVTIGGVWSSVVTDYSLSSKWMLRNELRYRTAQFFDDKQQSLIRPSVHYTFSPGFGLSAGITFSDNAAYDASGFTVGGTEINIYEDIYLNHGEGKWSFNHRYRFEHRWITQPSGEEIYRNRFRYRVQVGYAIADLNGGKLKAIMYNEIFINLFNDFTSNGYDRDWTGLGLVAPICSGLTGTVAVQQNWVLRPTDIYERQRLLLLSLGWKIK